MKGAKAPIRAEGRVKFYKEDKGFGFIRNPIDPTKDIFFHVTELPPGITLHGGDLVAFEMKQSRRGMVAAKIELMKRADPRPERKSAHEVAS